MPIQAHRRRSRTFLFTRGLLVSAVTLAIPALGSAGGWHVGSNLQCSDCHTMHNSWKGGQVMRYDGDAEGAPYLLRAGTTQRLCDQCHAGGAAANTSPTVIGPLPPAYAAVDPAGGFFTLSSDGTTLTGLGHTLGVVPQSVPFSTITTPTAIECLSCHDVHGNSRYRNLLVNPSRSGATTLDPTVDTSVAPDGSNPFQAYASTAMTYRNYMSEWCKDCHDAYPSTAHPSDLRLSDYAAVYTVWTTQPVDANGNPLPRVRVQHPDNVTPVPPSPSTGDFVFCLTCHRAHGSPNPKGLIYPDPTNSNSLCDQCHVPAP